MACVDHQPNLDLGTTTCAGHRGACASNRVPDLGTDVPNGGIIYASDIEDLRTNIRAEIDSWNAHALYNYTKRQAGAIAKGAAIADDHFNNLRSMVNEMNGSSISAVNSTTLIRDDNQWDDILSNYNTIRQNCICNTDCSCNTICSCYGDCGCNYSDKRLKENVEFIEEVNGIKWYNFTYTFDKFNRTYRGVIAQEILETEYADAVSKDHDGWYMVDYNQLPKQKVIETV